MGVWDSRGGEAKNERGRVGGLNLGWHEGRAGEW